MTKTELLKVCNNYRKEMDKLFTEWKEKQGCIDLKIKKKQVTVQINHRSHTFIRDGVVCPEKWFAQGIRPLFLLKEAYGKDQDWDLIDYLRDGSRRISESQMWRRISEWSCALLTTTRNSILPYQSWEPITYFGNQYLQQIAAINIKKSNGKPGSDPNEIRAYAMFDKDRLYRQIEICDPTVIVCGYTGEMLDNIVRDITGKSVKNNRNPNLYYHMELNGHDVLILDYWHPANQYPDMMNYYTLMAIYQQALLSEKGR